jgi:hypothetical protein
MSAIAYVNSNSTSLSDSEALLRSTDRALAEVLKASVDECDHPSVSNG